MKWFWDAFSSKPAPRASQPGGGWLPRLQFNSRDYESRLDYVDGVQRLQSVSLLYVGSVLGFAGFVFAAFLGFYKQMFEASHRNFRGETIGTYFPATVSEMVYNSSSGAGKCFFAFTLIGGICMLLSWYPWALRNVYIGDDLLLFSGWLGKDISGQQRGIKVLMLRQFLPPLGVMMVACIPAPPGANRKFTDTVSSIVHTLGAVMSIGGYALIEALTLTVWKNKLHFSTPINTRRRQLDERQVRLILIGLCGFCIIAFQVCGVVLGKADMLGIEGADVWQVPTPQDWNRLNNTNDLGLRVEDEIANARGQKMLKSTATGLFKLLKLCEYWFEVGAGLFMLASHLAIWYYCPERFVDLNESLPDPDGQDGDYSRAPQ